MRVPLKLSRNPGGMRIPAAMFATDAKSMTIIIETGSGLLDAESYASTAAADVRCASLGGQE